MNDPVPNFHLLWKQYKPIIITFLLLLVLYLILRLPNLTKIPIFADEAIYIRWAQVMKSESTLRFLPLSDGKQPLFMWLIIPALKIISDPLIAGRTISIFAGIGTLLGIFLLTLQLTKSQKHALIASLLYTISPYTFLFDRLALVDSLLVTFGTWSMYFAFKLLTKPQLSFSLLTGACLGASLLTKSPALFFLALLPFTAITLNTTLKKPRQKNFNFLTPTNWYFIKLIFYWGFSSTIAFGIYNILRLGPEFHMIAIRNKDYIFPINEILKHPTIPLYENLKNVFVFYWKLLTPIVFIVTLIGITNLISQKKKLLFFLLIWIIVPVAVQSFVARSVTARYFLYTLPPLFILASYGIHFLITKYKLPFWKNLILTSIAIPSLWFNFLLLTSPQKAPLPKIERSGYLEEWTAGYGLREIAKYLQQESQIHKIIVGTEGYFGTMPDGLQIYFDKNTNVTIVGQTHIIDHIPQQMYDSLEQNKVFFLVNSTRFKITNAGSAGLQLIKTFPKAVRPDNTQESLLFFEVVNQPNK